MEVVGRHIYGQPSAESSGGSMATAGDTPTKVQVTKAAPMLRQNQKRERAAAVFSPLQVGAKCASACFIRPSAGSLADRARRANQPTQLPGQTRGKSVRPF